MLRKFNLCRTQQINSNWYYNLMSLVIYCVFHPEKNLFSFFENNRFVWEVWSRYVTLDLSLKFKLWTGRQYYEGLSAVILEGSWNSKSELEEVRDLSDLSSKSILIPTLTSNLRLNYRNGWESAESIQSFSKWKFLSIKFPEILIPKLIRHWTSF